MIRRPPRSTLFPTRRSSDLAIATSAASPSGARMYSRRSGTGGRRSRLPLATSTRCLSAVRSEEHTSELQSRQYLVCRLLLEKKKNKTKQTKLEQKQKLNTSI